MKSIKDKMKEAVYSALTVSVRQAVSEQGLESLVRRLEGIVPDISDQYTTFAIDGEYLNTKARAMHAFQVSLADKVIQEFDKPVIVDIGDSSGTHIRYILGLYGQDKKIRALSVNLDPKAVERIRKKGLDAVHARAEDLGRHGVDADIFLCFETLEHLMDPARFLHELSAKTRAKYLVITVPYVRQSRVGLLHIRKNFPEARYAENTHIFELKPDDWRLLFKHSGWAIQEDRVYLQYPKMALASLTRPVWQRFDFEGFYGAILKKDSTYSSKYSDW